MVEVKVLETYDAPLQVGFDYIADYHNIVEFMFGLNFFRPVGDLDYGLGAVFDGGLSLGPVTLHSTLKVIEWEPNRRIKLDSIAGFDCDFEFKFAAVGENQVEVDTDVNYYLPGGIAGRALGQTIKPFVKIAVKQSVHNVRKLLPAYLAKWAPREV